jgi:hypothetical protein
MTSRGIRNNNPGNIRVGAKWQGLVAPEEMTPEQKAEKEFCVFKSAPWGIRAMARTLITYQDKRKAKDGSKIDTVHEVIARWAPPIENNTDAYADHVALKIGVSANDRIDVHSYEVMRPLIEAIILHENGEQPYTSAQIDKGLVLAGVEPAKPKSLQSSRTIKGAQVATGGTALTGAAEALQTAASNIEPLIPYLETMKWVFIAVTVVGIGITVLARIDDRNKGLR